MGAAAGPVAVRRAATRALEDAIPFAAECFTQPARAGEAEAIMSAVCANAADPDAEIRCSSFDCIVTVAGNFYSALAPFMQQLAQLSFTQAAAAPPGPPGSKEAAAQESVAVRAIELWTTIAEVRACTCMRVKVCGYTIVNGICRRRASCFPSNSRAPTTSPPWRARTWCRC
jgi:hypothetical protein